jgi:hypothetical protein
MTTDDPDSKPTDRSPEIAAELYQAFLDETSATMIGDAPERFAARVLLPYVMRTARDEIVLETLDDVIADTRHVIDTLRQMQLTDLIRIVLRARFIAPDTIEGWHRSYVLRGANTLTPPYENRLVLRLSDGVWKVIVSEHELFSGGGLPPSIVQSAAGSLAERWRQAHGQDSEPEVNATPLYSAFLTSLGGAVEASDFAAWAAHFTFPLMWHLADEDLVIERPEEIRDIFFDKQQNLAIDGRETEVQRRITQAHFLTDGRILGYHDVEWRDGAEVLFGPVTSRAVLRMQDGRLVAEDITNTLDTALFREGVLASTGALPTLREIQKRTKPGSARHDRNDRYDRYDKDQQT